MGAMAAVAQAEVIYSVTGLQGISEFTPCLLRFPIFAVNNGNAGAVNPAPPKSGLVPLRTTALAINNAGDVVGSAFTGQVYDPGDWQISVIHAFLWHNGQGTDLHNGDQLSSAAVDINDAGDILIRSFCPLMGPGEGQLYRSGTYRTLDAFSVGSVNEAGQVVGGENSGADFTWQDGRKSYPMDLAGWTSVTMNQINDSGWIVGQARGPGGYGGAFLQIPGSAPIELGTLGYCWSDASAINNHGQVVGGANTTWDETHAFLWTQEGGMKDLGTLGGDATANAINELGQIVGTSGLSGTLGLSKASSSYVTHAFLYEDGHMCDLNNLIDPSSGWILTEANDINDLGQIVGAGLFNGRQEGFILTLNSSPEITEVPEPATLATLTLGCLCLLRRKATAATI
jgi:probable HAF family extracellular repeat protein